MKKIIHVDEIGLYAKEVRKHHKLTITDISEDMNFSHVYIGRLENGKFKKNIETMLEYLNFLGINIYLESIEYERGREK